MAHSTSYEDVTNIYRIPVEVYSQIQPFCLDAGSTLLKLVYKSKKDGMIDDGEKVFGVLRCEIFPQNGVDEIISFLKEHCNMDDLKAYEPLALVGIGSYANIAVFENEFKIKFEVLNEIKAQNRAVMLANKYIHMTDLVVNFDETDEKEAIKKYKKYYQNDAEIPYAGSSHCLDEHIQYPVLRAMLGTGFAAWRLDSDGIGSEMEFYWPGGLAFEALYPIITGAKTFDELTTLAALGDSRTISRLIGDIQKPLVQGGESTYKALFDKDKANALVFFFEKPTNMQNAPKADIAAAFLDMWIAGMISYMGSKARENKCNTVLFSGSFLENDFIQKRFHEISTATNVGWLMVHGKTPLKYLVLKNPGFYGALGAMVWKLFAGIQDEDPLQFMYL